MCTSWNLAFELLNPSYLWSSEIRVLKRLNYWEYITVFQKAISFCLNSVGVGAWSRRSRQPIIEPQLKGNRGGGWGLIRTRCMFFSAWLKCFSARRTRGNCKTPWFIIIWWRSSCSGDNGREKNLLGEKKFPLIQCNCLLNISEGQFHALFPRLLGHPQKNSSLQRGCTGWWYMCWNVVDGALFCLQAPPSSPLHVQKNTVTRTHTHEPCIISGIWRSARPRQQRQTGIFCFAGNHKHTERFYSVFFF